MSLLLNGAKTMTIAGTEMQCLEIYTGEAYTFPISFTDANGNPANCQVPANWNIAASAKYYDIDNVVYDENGTTVTLGNLTLATSQPSTANYTLQADFVNRAAGTAYLYLGNNITGNTGSTPTISLANSAANSTLFLVTLTVTRQSGANASLNDINREPLGFIVRYQ
jgi:hypothetical protein